MTTTPRMRSLKAAMPFLVVLMLMLAGALPAAAQHQQHDAMQHADTTPGMMGMMQGGMMQHTMEHMLLHLRLGAFRTYVDSMRAKGYGLAPAHVIQGMEGTLGETRDRVAGLRERLGAIVENDGVGGGVGGDAG